MINIEEIWIDIYCPKCSYSFNVQMIDLKLQSIVYCDNCKSSIKLTDQDASVHNSIKDINNSLIELEQTFKNIFK